MISRRKGHAVVIFLLLIVSKFVSLLPDKHDILLYLMISLLTAGIWHYWACVSLTIVWQQDKNQERVVSGCFVTQVQILSHVNFVTD